MKNKRDELSSNANELKSNNNILKSNTKFCYYCNTFMPTNRNYFCSNMCLKKYWAGVYRHNWNEGDHPININDGPTLKDLENEKKEYLTRKLSKKILKGSTNCMLCNSKFTDKNRMIKHPINKNVPESFIPLCSSCFLIVKKYNNLKKQFDNYTNIRRLNNARTK